MRPDSLSGSLWAGIYTKVNTFVQVVCYRESVLQIQFRTPKTPNLAYTIQSYEGYLNCVIKGFSSNPTSNASGGTSPYHFIKRGFGNWEYHNTDLMTVLPKKQRVWSELEQRGQNRRCKRGQNGGKVWSQICQMRAPSTQSVFNLSVTSNALAQLFHLLNLHTFCPATPNLRIVQWAEQDLGNSIQELHLKTEEEQEALWLMCKISLREVYCIHDSVFFFFG